MKIFIVLAALVISAFAEPAIYLKETFEDGDGWTGRWVESKHQSDYGKFKLTAGNFYGDAEKDKGLQTSQDAKFYALSTKFDKFSNRDKTLVIQFTVKHEQKIDCGGGYVKVFPSTLDQTDMYGESQYNIMFGPDICGPGTKKVHVIFNYKGQNLLIKKEIRCKDDEFTHLYTLIVRPDNTYEVKIDNEKAQSGTLEEDWDFLPPKEIPDPEAKKPEDWVDSPTMPDPDDVKPEDWDVPEHIPDPEAQKPEDWDDDGDGEWEPPMIGNPDFKGEWKPKQIPNPEYKGEWVHPKVPNPEYKEDNELYLYEDFGAVGLDLWQVKSGTIFDNFLITDDEEFAAQFGKETWGATKDPEKKMKDEVRLVMREADDDNGGGLQLQQDEVERKKREAEEEERKKNEAATAEEEEEEEEETKPDDDGSDAGSDDSDDDDDSSKKDEL